MFDFLTVQSPDWARVETRGIVYPGSPLQYRFDGQCGQFRVGTEQIGEELIARPFLWRWLPGQRWGRAAQAWFDLAFVDADGIVSVLSLNKGSAINLYSDLCRLVRAGLEPKAHCLRLAATEAVVTLVSEDGESRESEYSAVRVAGCEPVELRQFLELSEFTRSGRFEWVLAGEVSE